MQTPSRMIPLLNVEDVARSIRFYGEIAGFACSARHEDGGAVVWAEIRRGDIVLMLNSPDGIDSAARRARPDYREVVFYFWVEDAPALHADLAARGVDVGPLARQPYGTEEFMLRDPDGYELAFGSPLRAAPA